MVDKVFMRAFLLFTLFSILFLSTHLAAADKPGYLVHRTGDLILYFSTDLDPRLIPYLIEKTELAEQFLFSLYGWKADRRIPLVFDRETDESNGWSQVYQRDGIRLLLYPPEELSVLATHKDYALNLIVHELTHSFQIGLTSGVPKWINYLFGNLFYPAQLSPGWLLEGVAVYSESSVDGTGRLHSPLWRAWFDSFFRKGNELTLGELSGSNDHWMGGHIPYLYGTFFYDFLFRRHGAEKTARFFDELGDNVLPFLHDWEAKELFGETFWTMYQAFLKSNRERIFERTAAAQAPNETGLRYRDIAVDLSRGDRYVYLGNRQGERAIYAYDGKEQERLFAPPETVHFAAAPDGRYLLTIPYRSDPDRLRTELFLFDTAAGTIRRLLPGESALYPFFLPDGDIACFTATDGLIDLRLFDGDGGETRRYDLAAFDSVHTPSADPAGSRIVFTGNLRGNGKDIFLLDIATGAVNRIPLEGDQYGASFAGPQELLFSSAEGDRVAPFLLDLTSGALQRLHEPINLALYPKIIGGRLFFVGFDNDGYFPAWTTPNPVAAGDIDPATIAAIAAGAPPQAATAPILTRSSGWEGLWPTLILPDYSGGMHSQRIGITLFAEADTGRRGYSLYFGKTFDATDRYETGFAYRDDDILPNFHWQAYYGWHRETFGNPEERTYPGSAHDFRTSISTTIPFNTLFYLGPARAVKIGHSLSASVGFHLREERVENDWNDPTILPYDAGESYEMQLGASYNLYLSFSPGSYLLFSEMDGSALRLPATLTRDLMYGASLLTLSPSLTGSYLFGKAGKVGLISRHSLYAAFLSDASYAVGGEEKGIELQSIDAFIYGYSSNVTVRGYRPEAMTGSLIYFANTELRYHIFAIEQGLGLFPIMLKNLQGALFVDIGASSGERDRAGEPFIASAGAEVKLLTQWWYHVPLMFKLGIAHGLTKNGVLNVYFSLGNSF